MSADELRQAAETLRNPYRCNTPTYETALADWLDATAVRIDGAKPSRAGGRNNHSWRGSREAVTVARLINGGAA